MLRVGWVGCGFGYAQPAGGAGTEIAGGADTELAGGADTELAAPVYTQVREMRYVLPPSSPNPLLPKGEGELDQSPSPLGRRI